MDMALGLRWPPSEVRALTLGDVRHLNAAMAEQARRAKRRRR